MSPFLSAVLEANRTLKDALKDFDPDWHHACGIGAGGDISSGLDLFAEAIFFERLQQFGAFESEESGLIGEGKGRIILDPIDGSANALSRFPYYGTSVALLDYSGVLREAAVCNLATDEIFLRTNQGEILEGRLEEQDALRAPLIENCAQVGLFEKAYAHPSIVAKLDSNDLKFRAPGAVALSLAYARRVKYVLYVGEFRIYDFAAGLALCEGLEVAVEQDYVIVSKDKNTLQTIEAIVRAHR